MAVRVPFLFWLALANFTIAINQQFEHALLLRLIVHNINSSQLIFVPLPTEIKGWAVLYQVGSETDRDTLPVVSVSAPLA